MAIILSIDIIEDDVIAEVAHVIETAGICGAARIRGAHVGREITKDIPKRHFIPNKLSSALDLRYFVQVLMGPGMTGHLVSAKNHALDERSPRDIGAVNLTFAIVVSGDEESYLGAVFVKEVKEIFRVLVGPVIVGQSNGSGGSARANGCRAVGGFANLGSCNCLCRRASRSSMGIAMTIVDLAVGRATVSRSVSTVSCLYLAVGCLETGP